ncbi:MAG TPA: hypothetical protein VN706_23135 [Gemmatimonadaceae bacterium]|nr:hypothetical protein [Gemmatimonadaceae bacterium]
MYISASGVRSDVSRITPESRCTTDVAALDQHITTIPPTRRPDTCPKVP